MNSDGEQQTDRLGKPDVVKAMSAKNGGDARRQPDDRGGDDDDSPDQQDAPLNAEVERRCARLRRPTPSVDADHGLTVDERGIGIDDGALDRREPVLDEERPTRDVPERDPFA